MTDYYDEGSGNRRLAAAAPRRAARCRHRARLGPRRIHQGAGRRRRLRLCRRAALAGVCRRRPRRRAGGRDDPRQARRGAERPRALLRRPRHADGDVRHPRRSAAYGVRTLILTNAAGGINLSFKPGTLMLMDDHINMLGSNPLVGPNEERFGPRFPDMTEVYSSRLRGIAVEAAAALGQRLARGVYVARPRPELRDAGGDPFLPHDRRGCGRHVHGSRGDRRAAHGPRGARDLVHHQSGGGSAADSRSCTTKSWKSANRVRAEFSALLEAIIERV